MTSAAAPAEDDESKRPATVTVAAGLMVVVAVIYLVVSAVALTSFGRITSAIGGAAGRFDDSTGGISTFRVSLVVTVVVDVAVAITLVLLAVGNLRRRRGARAGTRVIAGLFLLCALCGSIGNGTAASGGTDLGPDNALLRGELLPSWYTPTMIALDVLLMVLLAGVIVLLALAPSNRYFDV